MCQRHGGSVPLVVIGGIVAVAWERRVALDGSSIASCSSSASKRSWPAARSCLQGHRRERNPLGSHELCGRSLPGERVPYLIPLVLTVEHRRS